MHLIRCLLQVPGEPIMSLMSGALGMHGHASEAESHRARGDDRALLHREAGLETQDTWRHRSPSLLGGGPGATGHMATLEPFPVWWWARWHRAHVDVKALPYREMGLEPRDMW
jgi:hypothetical protein